MKKNKIFTIIVLSVLFCTFFVFLFVNRLHKTKFTSQIQFDTNQFDLAAVDCLPQKLLDIKDFGSVSRITVRCKDSFNDFSNTKFSKDNSDLQKYLQQTEYIDFENSIVKDLSEVLGLSKLNAIECAKEILKTINQATGFIEYDSQLARQISMGNTYGRSASETLNIKKGTCGEFTNVFIALMRLNNIPTKYVQGYWIAPEGQTLHAWAEFYDENKGWISVDPQVGMFGITKYQVKILEGIDFSKIGADFSSLVFANAKILNEE